MLRIMPSKCIQSWKLHAFLSVLAFCIGLCILIITYPKYGEISEYEGAIKSKLFGMLFFSSLEHRVFFSLSKLQHYFSYFKGASIGKMLSVGFLLLSKKTFSPHNVFYRGRSIFYVFFSLHPALTLKPPLLLSILHDLEGMKVF